LNTVVAPGAVGEKVIEALGTLSVIGVPPAVNWIVASSKRTVTGLALSPCTLRALLNQMKLLLAMGVPLK